MQRRFTKYIFILIILIMPVLCTVVMAQDSKVLYDQYFIYRIKNVQIGYEHITQKAEVQNSKNIITTNKHSEQKLQRFGFPVKILQDIQFVEDESGTPVSFSAITQNQGDNSSIQGKFIGDGKVLVIYTVNGISKTEEIKLKNKILFPYAIDNLFKNNSNKDKIEYSTIDPSADFRIINLNAEKIGSEMLTSDNLEGNYNKYKVTMDLLPNIDTTEWHNSEGRTVKELSSILNIESLAVDKDKIYAETKPLDILSSSLIPVDTSISDPFSLDQVNYKVEINSQVPENIFISDDRQRIIQSTGNVTYLKIKDEHPIEGKYTYPVNTKGFSEFLKSGPFIMPDDNAVKIQAITLAGQDKDAYKTVKVMEKWVYNTITKKDFSVNFASAKEVMKTRRGDCTEHSVLLASLLRAAGIPSKVVIGLMYTDKPEKAFAYHMWVKAYIGKWINLDPSFPCESFSPAHIALYETPLNTISNRTDLILNLVKSFSNIKITILNFPQTQSDPINKKAASETLPVDDRFKISNFLKSDPVNSEGNNDSIEEYIKAADASYSQGDMKAAFDNYKSAFALIPYNDDYLEIALAKKLAKLGFLNLSDEKLKNIYNSEIWGQKISEIRQVYFPKKLLTQEKELILADALAKIDIFKNPDGAIELINRNKDILSNEYSHYILARAYIEKNETRKAIDELQKLIRQNSENLSYRFELAEIYISKNELKKAKNEMNFVLNHNITDKEWSNDIQTQSYWLNFKLERKDKLKSQYYLAKYYQSKGELSTAVDILNKLVNEKIKDNTVYDLLGEIYLSLNQPDKAEISFKSSLEINEEDTPAIIGLGDIAFLQKNYETSLQKYLLADKISDSSAELFNKIAGNYRVLSQEEKAYKYYNKALMLDNMNFKANFDIGTMYFEMGEYNKAGQYLAKALFIKPFNADIWLKLAKIEIDNKNYFLAKTYLIPVCHIDNQNPDYYYYLGIINKYNENFSDARSDFTMALEIKPQYQEVLKELKELNSL